MDALTRYVVTYFSRLMTPTEAAVRSSIFWQEKWAYSESEAMRRMIERHISSDSEVIRMLAEGPDQCLRRIRERILRDHAGEALLNLCPRCGELARTPTARQGRKCFFSWHEEQ